MILVFTSDADDELVHSLDVPAPQASESRVILFPALMNRARGAANCLGAIYLSVWATNATMSELGPYLGLARKRKSFSLNDFCHKRAWHRSDNKGAWHRSDTGASWHRSLFSGMPRGQWFRMNMRLL